MGTVNGTGSEGGRPRGPGLVYSALSIVLVLILTVVALTMSQPPPPTIAEFAPQAQETIREAPDEQTSGFGSGPGGRGEPGAIDPVTGLIIPTPPPIDVPRVRRCVGDPPRQIEDPQSPPCVPYWKGDNGGSTSAGVTPRDIRVAIPTGNPPLSPAEAALEGFFNSRFEFYGRHLTLHRYEPLGGSGDGDATDPSQMQADARQVAETIDPFAVIAYPGRRNEYIFYDELARLKILSVGSRPNPVGESHFERWSPYQWSYIPGLEPISQNLGHLVCGSLEGRDAQYAGPGVAGKPRSFGIISSVAADGSKPDLKDLRDALGKCGVQAQEEEIRDEFPPPQQTAQQIMIRFQTSDVTSIICMCHAYPLQYLQPAASGQGYYPEWIISTYQYNDEDIGASIRPRDQANNTFGITSWNKALPTRELWSYQAILEANPGFGGFFAGDPEAQAFDRYFYKPLLQLASGIQLAGPELTPESFEGGLFRSKFPNPGAGGPPHYQAHVSFGPGDRSMQGDVALIWWNSAEQSEFNARGTYCFVEKGRRYSVGSWPTGSRPFFQGSCR